MANNALTWCLSEEVEDNVVVVYQWHGADKKKLY